jgi:CheY-like chemotaxis protein/HPt (histidine-containing phosphotransfer) domain-containing protein
VLLFAGSLAATKRAWPKANPTRHLVSGSRRRDLSLCRAAIVAAKLSHPQYRSCWEGKSRQPHFVTNKSDERLCPAFKLAIPRKGHIHLWVIWGSSPMSGKPTDSTNTIDCLRINEEQHRQLVEALDLKAQAPKGSDHRQHERFPYLVPCGISLSVKHPEAKRWQRYLVRPRNISAGGVGFFHGAYLYKGTYCEISLRTRKGEIVEQAGHVVHIRHIVGRIHEVGVAFETPLDVRQFIQCSDEEEFDETAQQQFQGQVLCIDGWREDRALLKFQIKELGAAVTEVSDAPEALEALQSGHYDLVILGQSLATMMPEELAQAMREDGYEGPIVECRDGSSPSDWSNGLLPKPFGSDDVQKLLERYLPQAETNANHGPEPLHSDLWPKKNLRSLILNYLETLEEQTFRLQQLVDEQETDELISLTRKVKESAGSYGYPSISDAAQAVLDAYEREPQQMSEAVHQVIALCQRACAFRAQVDYEPKPTTAG